MDYATKLASSIMGLSSKAPESSNPGTYAGATKGTNSGYSTSRGHDSGSRYGALGDSYPSNNSSYNAYDQLQQRDASGRINQSSPSRSTFTYDPVTRTAGHHEVWTPPASTHYNDKSSSYQRRRESSPPPRKHREKTPPPRSRTPPPPLSKPPNDSAVLVLKGEQLIVSYDGTSQYAQGGGVSACGLAALNCARIVLGKSKRGILEAQLLEEIISERTVQEIVSICPMWTGSAHLEVDEIAELPIFSNFLDRKGVNWGKATRSGFDKMLKRLEKAQDYPAVVMVITKSPEIIACLRISVQEQNVFIIFDSHSRPSHPNGSGLVIDANRERILDRLVDLMGVDEELLNDPEFSWQMEMLSQFSEHCYVPKPEDPNLESLILQLSVQSYAKKHDADERLKPIRDERDRLTSQLKEWQTYAKSQTASADAFKREAEKIHKEALRNFEAQRNTLTQEIEKLRSQVQEAEGGRSDFLTTIVGLNERITVLENQLSQAQEAVPAIVVQVQPIERPEDAAPPGLQHQVQDVPQSPPASAHSPRSEGSVDGGYMMVNHESGSSPSESDVVMTDASEVVQQEIAQEKRSLRSNSGPSEDKKSHRSSGSNGKSSRR
ncbi:hypothetical protein BDN72DRAFT_895661 [Pluteus cervinus]|uniref:Uncharacterized protein n=1 Tax=Pluteus cervinus TaxID=181527 RepID=A0ACD3B1G8_9AGAR|nr:hypothetical protein BDN72DRAFT_895661 [Pluteus cervinus]